MYYQSSIATWGYNTSSYTWGYSFSPLNLYMSDIVQTHNEFLAVLVRKKYLKKTFLSILDMSTSGMGGWAGA